MSDELYPRVERIFRAMLDDEQFQDFGPEANMDSVDGWDSLNFLNVILDIENEFGIRIDGLDAANMISVPNIITYLQANT